MSGGVTVNSITYVSPTSVTLNLSTVGAPAGTKSITITNPDGQSATGTNILTVTKLAQTITFNPLPGKTFGDPPFTVSATGGASGNPVTFSAAPPTVCTVSGSTVTITGVGTCTITADQAGDAIYNAAPSVPQSFAVAQASQTISFGALRRQDLRRSAVRRQRNGRRLGQSGHVQLADDGRVHGRRLDGHDRRHGYMHHRRGSGRQRQLFCRAAGDAKLQRRRRRRRRSASARFPTRSTADPPFGISATGGGSGNPVTFSSLTTGVCTVSGSTVTLVAIGTCTIAADQAGNANYLAAPQVLQSFTVTAGPAASITASAGTPQSAAINTNYAAPLSVTGERRRQQSGQRRVGDVHAPGVRCERHVPGRGDDGHRRDRCQRRRDLADGHGQRRRGRVRRHGNRDGRGNTRQPSIFSTPAVRRTRSWSRRRRRIGQFITESGTGAGSFVTGPATPPAGTGSVELQALSTDGGELLLHAAIRGHAPRHGEGPAIQHVHLCRHVRRSRSDFDVDADLSSPTAVYEGRLVFSPGLLPGAVVPGVWQTWDAYTQKAWYATRPPINATCTQATPCTLADILAAYPNAGVIAQLFAGTLGFKLGNNGATGTVSVDKLVLVREGPPATLTAWTYDFEPVSPAPATVTATAGTPQSTPVNTAFALPLTAEVRDAATQLLSGVTVTFDLPGSGASGTFPGSVIIGQRASPRASSARRHRRSSRRTGLPAVYAASATAGAATPRASR